jgi:hypothetical protein
MPSKDKPEAGPNTHEEADYSDNPLTDPVTGEPYEPAPATDYEDPTPKDTKAEPAKRDSDKK